MVPGLLSTKSGLQNITNGKCMSSSCFHIWVWF